MFQQHLPYFGGEVIFCVQNKDQDNFTISGQIRRTSIVKLILYAILWKSISVDH